MATLSDIRRQAWITRRAKYGPRGHGKPCYGSIRYRDGGSMIPKRISDATHYLGAPKGWNPATDGDCAHLAVRVVEGNVCESAWEPTPDELAALNAGGAVILRVVGGQPPVMLCVEPVAADE